MSRGRRATLLPVMKGINRPLAAKDAPSSGLSSDMFSPLPLLYVCGSAEMERESHKKTGK